jgi:hypothetical protein
MVTGRFFDLQSFLGTATSGFSPSRTPHIAHPSIGTISGQSLGNDRRTDVGAVVQVANAYVLVAGLLPGQLA